MTRSVRFVSILSLVAAMAVAGSVRDSSAQTAQLCLSGQLRAAGNICKSMTRCYSMAMKKGGSVGATCISGLSSKLAVAYDEIEALSTCLVEDGDDDVASALAAGVADIANALTLGGGKCAATKMAALGKECAGYLRCYAAGAADSSGVDASCLAFHEAKLLKSFTKAESKGGCTVSGDSAALQAKVGDVSSATYTILRGSGTTTTTTSTSTSTVTVP